jgi:hypothetical protein
VKNARKYSVVLFIAVLYHFSFYILTYSPIIFSFQNDPNSLQNELVDQMYDYAVRNLFKYESRENICSNLVSPVKKLNFVDYYSVNESIENVFQSEFGQYNSFSKNLLIKFRKTDLLFPFNYFW